MNGIVKKLLTWLVLPAIIVLLGYAIVDSVMQPVRFNKEKAAREVVAIQQLKDIRTLEVAYKSAKGVFTSCVDSLADFYQNGEMSIIMQVGSSDDSAAVAHTDAVKKSFRGVKPSEINKKLYDLYLNGDKNLVFIVESKIPVKDTLFASRAGFDPMSLKAIPYADGDTVIMDAIVKTVSGVQVPLFEAKIPYKKLLKGMDNQLRINLDAERKNMNRYEGLQVGSITAPNNNAGNWE